MEAKREAKHLRIFISNTDKFRYSPLYEVIVFAAKRYGMAGVTVLKGVMGYGSSSTVRSMKFWEVTEKLPLVIEIIDEADKVVSFAETIMPYFDKLKTGCVMTIEKANILLYKTGQTH
ncbi:MAG: DUF190 domain-containing protein [Bacteroidales bacterium]|jgi:hypothetical protein|nr:DUF190 domain-containing protein [Bacteroidales bacterium]